MLDRLFWIDTETFGIKPEIDPILEIGFVMTDLEFQVLGSFSELCWEPGWYDDYMAVHKTQDSFVYKMHLASGLWDEAKARGQLMHDVELDALAWLEKMGVTKDDPLSGSTVGFDRGMLSSWMPEIDKRFHYRSIDISSLKELCKRYNPHLFSQLEKSTDQQKLHRVIPDINDTINEFQFYADNFLRVEL